MICWDQLVANAVVCQGDFNVTYGLYRMFVEERWVTTLGKPQEFAHRLSIGRRDSQCIE
jgi:hypothetical protein